jgi:hypothetical protein
MLVFLPDIVKQGATKYVEDTGLTQEPFLGRWLMPTAVVFAASAISYAVRLTIINRHTPMPAGARR